jgi:hypothetical protein
VITYEQYFVMHLGKSYITDEMSRNATELLERVNKLLAAAAAAGIYNNDVDPDTGTQISGSKNGAGDGGFRGPKSATGVVGSRHRSAQAIDVYDPDGRLDFWLKDVLLAEYSLYREHPSKTPGWCHLQSVAPSSGRRTFWP